MEITKEQAKELEIGTFYYVYNPLTQQIKEEQASNKDIVHNKYCYKELRFFTIKPSEEMLQGQTTIFNFIEE